MVYLWNTCSLALIGLLEELLQFQVVAEQVEVESRGSVHHHDLLSKTGLMSLIVYWRP